MCYLVAKWFSKSGSLALSVDPGAGLIELTDELEREFGMNDLQLVTISRPSAYGEYEPYEFVDSKDELLNRLKQQSAA